MDIDRYHTHEAILTRDATCARCHSTIAAGTSGAMVTIDEGTAEDGPGPSRITCRACTAQAARDAADFDDAYEAYLATRPDLRDQLDAQAAYEAQHSPLLDDEATDYGQPGAGAW